MFSPAKAITAGALVFAIGGILLVAQPYDQGRGGTVPGAATAPVDPVTFTASLRPGSDVGSTTLTEVDGRVERRGTVWAPTLTVSDPRLEGEVRLASPQDQYPGAAGPESFTFGTVTWRIENEEGAWQGTEVGFSIMENGVESGGGGTLVLVGEGTYEGLYAALDVSDPRDMRGVIFPAPPPPHESTRS